MYDLVDIGLNLTHDSFDRDREAVLERAQRAGVGCMILTGASVTSSTRALELAASRPGQLFSTAGIHPHHASECDVHSVPALAALLRSDTVVAVGECGLDYFRNLSPPDAQERAFLAQLELAVSCGRPVFLHQRDAHERFIVLLRPYISRIAGGVAHCFTGGPSELEDYLSLDLYIGVTGWLCDERRGQALRAALPRLPLDRLLLETDAPYLLPRDLTPKPASRRNEPAYLTHVLEHAAALLDVPAAELAAASTRNAVRLFGLHRAGGAALMDFKTARELLP
jgi:TatD DNase family protein